MTIFNELRNEMQQMEKEIGYKGYSYKISDVLTIMICGLLCNLQNVSDIYDWASEDIIKEFFLERFGIRKLPSRAQFYNILGKVDPKKFQEVFVSWMKKILGTNTERRTISIDGKTIRSTEKMSTYENALHIASAIIAESKLVLGSLPCDTKISEPEIFRELMEILDVEGAIVIADALHCRKKSAQKVIDEKADYIFSVKDNNPNLKSDIELFIKNEDTESYTTTEKNGGRFEKRTAYISSDIDWLPNKEEWAGLKAIGAVHTEFEKNGEKTDEWHYYISSAELSAEELLKHARLEWTIESMHWLLDVHYAEDKTRVWDKNIQQTLNIMRKIALNLARKYKTEKEPRKAISGILKRNLYNIENLAEFLFFIIALNDISDLLQN